MYFKSNILMQAYNKAHTKLYYMLLKYILNVRPLKSILFHLNFTGFHTLLLKKFLRVGVMFLQKINFILIIRTTLMGMHVSSTNE